MRMKKALFLLVIAASFLQSGCSLVNLPLELAGLAMGIASEAIGIAQTLPLPPPWLFF
jgi:uncharacterized membrane-anchored protein YitT (DUF2179 family)